MFHNSEGADHDHIYFIGIYFENLINDDVIFVDLKSFHDISNNGYL